MNLHTMLLISHVLISAGIIALVLLQRGKGADAGAAFGSGSSGTVFGAKGAANFLSRSTAVLATLFFVTSLSLAYLGSQRQESQSLMDAGAGAVTILPTDDGASSTQEGLPELPGIGDSVTEDAPAAPAPQSEGAQ
jgi:preprotein translocase subunit SecG